MAASFQANTLYDSFFAFEAGMNAGYAPLLLDKNQLAFGLNTTVRGTFLTHRPSFRKIALSFGGDATLQDRFEHGKWQGAGYYKDDNGTCSLCAAISGRLFQIIITGNTGTVIERAPVGDPNYPNPEAQRQAWLWQSEKWLIYQDGISSPLFFDGTTTVRSNYGTPLNYTTTTAGAFTVPAKGGTAAAVPFTDVTHLVVGDIVTIKFRGTFQVADIAGANVDLLNLTATPIGQKVPSGKTASWTHIGTQLPPGRMGVYGMGRNWCSLVDGKQFLASDLVGGSSGTVANNYRDAVLEITENLYLAGGGKFCVPGNPGDIKAMRFAAILDASLGQGPLQVLTPNNIFSCSAPVDRLTWQDVTNPILTESLIGSGGLSQNATVVVNGDLIFRSRDGIRSLILGRRDFSTWGNVPCSAEVDPILRRDARSLLEFSTAVEFDNRLLMSTSPVLDAQGVYWRGLVALNFDPISSMRGKAPSVYDGSWSGLNVFQMVSKIFDNVERCFAFTLNASEHLIELWEILPEEAGYYDADGRRIIWEFETPVMDFGQKDPRKRELLQLADGELHVDNLLGTVDFYVYYRPDQWPCWVPWHSWRECAKEPDAAKPETANYQPQFRPSMGFGEPSPVACDVTNNRPLRQGYGFQIKVVIQGHCRVLGARFGAHTGPEPAFAKQVRDGICEDVPSTVPAGRLTRSGVHLVAALEAVTQNDGTVVPIITGNQQQASNQLGTNEYGRVRNLSDGKWYELVSSVLDDGTVIPLLDKTGYKTPGVPRGRVRNLTDGLWYDIVGYKVEGGDVVPICDQTSHAAPNNP